MNVDNFRCVFSDGGGRTGTYIALDKLHRAGRRNGRVNVAKCLKEMCEQRMNIVENVVSKALRRKRHKSAQFIYYTVKLEFIMNICEIQ